jgi:hypothetical protein
MPIVAYSFDGILYRLVEYKTPLLDEMYSEKGQMPT